MSSCSLQGSKPTVSFVVHIGSGRQSEPDSTSSALNLGVAGTSSLAIMFSLKLSSGTNRARLARDCYLQTHMQCDGQGSGENNASRLPPGVLSDHSLYHQPL